MELLSSEPTVGLKIGRLVCLLYASFEAWLVKCNVWLGEWAENLAGFFWTHGKSFCKKDEVYERAQSSKDSFGLQFQSLWKSHRQSTQWSPSCNATPLPETPMFRRHNLIILIYGGLSLLLKQFGTSSLNDKFYKYEICVTHDLFVCFYMVVLVNRSLAQLPDFVLYIYLCFLFYILNYLILFELLWIKNFKFEFQYLRIQFFIN